MNEVKIYKENASTFNFKSYQIEITDEIKVWYLRDKETLKTIILEDPEGVSYLDEHKELLKKLDFSEEEFNKIKEFYRNKKK